jgi:hypothetical protein
LSTDQRDELVYQFVLFDAPTTEPKWSPEQYKVMYDLLPRSFSLDPDHDSLLELSYKSISDILFLIVFVGIGIVILATVYEIISQSFDEE